MKRLILSVALILATTGVCFADDFDRQMEAIRQRQQMQYDVGMSRQQQEFRQMETDNQMRRQQQEIRDLQFKQQNLENSTLRSLQRRDGLW
jgi:uncharacterized protein HemX